MDIKLVYVVTSSLSDIYWEQSWVSAWSAKLHNPSIKIAIVADRESLKEAENSYRKNSFYLFDEFIPVEMDSSLNKKQRSRWLKTNLRNIVSGDFLFIDSDTIVTGSLDELDVFPHSVAMVYDSHKHPCVISDVFPLYKSIYGEEAPRDMKYYNSGVMLVRDDSNAKKLFDKWFENWKLAGDKANYTDQIPLARTILKQDIAIQNLPDIYNCQVCNSIRYLYQAKILHIFNHPWFVPTIIHPLMLPESYIKVKNDMGISSEIEYVIKNCKSLFGEISVPIGLNEASFLHTSLVRILYKWYNGGRSSFNKLDSIIYFLGRKIFSTKSFR